MLEKLKIFRVFKTASVISALFMIFACEYSETGYGTGKVSLSLTDAPIADASDVEGVFITIESISYNLNNEWITAENFTGPQKFNLLELTNGNVAPLADTEISSGEVSQIRFILSAGEQGSGSSSGTPGCYIAIDPDGVTDGDESDDINYELFVPSGSQSGFKANGPFTVPVNGTVEITADFDVRKSVVYTGNQNQAGGSYLLKPTIRLIVNNQAGSIKGSFTDSTGSTDSYTVFAYDDGTYSDTEAVSADSQSTPFANAVTSVAPADSDSDGVPDSYTLAFLAPGTYDLIIARPEEDGSYTVIDTSYENIVVESETVTTTNIEITTPQ